MRAILNYKNIPYRTEWLEFPDIRPTLKSFGIPPNDPSEHFDHSIPAVKLPDGTFVMESAQVAQALEKYQPDPPVYPDSESAIRAQELVTQFGNRLSVAYLHRLPDMLLTPESAKWYHEARTRLIGASLYDLRDSPDLGEGVAWKNAEPTFAVLKEFLSENPEGPYAMGQQVSYADFVLLGFWKILGKIDVEGDLFGRVMEMDRKFEEHERACRKFCEKDD